VLVPHLRNRPFTMKRRPYGMAGDAYFQKQAPKGMPSWIPTRKFLEATCIPLYDGFRRISIRARRRWAPDGSASPST
jgi:hypothetical protein